MKFLQLNFLPSNPSLGLLVLRAWLGLSMLLLHGMGKIEKLGASEVQFADPFGIGPKASLFLAVFAEVVCSALLVVGLFTRLSAVFLIVTMSVAFFVAHGGKLSGPGNGELAFIYLAGYVTLLLAGAGRYSIDSKLGAK